MTSVLDLSSSLRPGKLRHNSLVRFLLHRTKAHLLHPVENLADLADVLSPPLVELVEGDPHGDDAKPTGETVDVGKPAHVAVAFLGGAKDPALMFEVQKAAAHAIGIPFAIVGKSADNVFEKYEVGKH